MQKYWGELLILAYAITSIDLIVTARGILILGWEEGNPFVTAIIPNGHPYQIHIMVISNIAAFWFLYWVNRRVVIEMQPENQTRYYTLISILAIVACCSHLFGTLTWLHTLSL